MRRTMGGCWEQRWYTTHSYDTCIMQGQGYDGASNLKRLHMLEDDSWMTLEQLEARGEQRHQARRKIEMYWRQFSTGKRTLDTRTINCLTNSGIETIEELAQKTEVELLELPNVGRKTIHDIRTFLEFKGLTIKPPPTRRLDAQPWYKFCL